MNWYLKVLNQYTDFSGRARRKEYWMYALFNLIFAMVALMVDLLLGTSFDIGGMNILGYGYIYMLYNLFVLIPGLAVLVRRLHDVGKSGWFILISIIPLIGGIWLLVLLVTDSDAGNNKWGSNPKTGGDEIDMLGTVH